ncbi:hypothetical protein HBI56_023960 [Parastagonospora nodorum]|uniref:Uncharacterized protein n=1 Tax=Phaeosphaeria nodorum (strain SN15 / ATCC MYA-4574 / FGSC 10173) TaxID=321614 RepID=A0A7U2I3T4_PHANO|nr:hypothetical protein HBH56_024550 [Parastagonospora nodorum]QRC98806.1 hypothetical protein JI435_412580 [Parastagonospora nodorum SN15]KAH3934279.1 hypothetical protein HBH54_057460 [Parastagonospora nodorum]KAH3949749.1 hypothetical protein HBH53_085150 [Parastagonospora nodorum]KAH3976127.1 hypothetical protein HBH51_080210 [Parastagonospora nodorum]
MHMFPPSAQTDGGWSLAPRRKTGTGPSKSVLVASDFPFSTAFPNATTGRLY